MLRLSLAWVAVSVLFFDVSVAAANAASKAATTVPPGEVESESWIRKGVELRRNGANDQALEAFLQAHRIRPSGRTKGQIGLAHQSLREWVKAADCLDEALASHEPWIEKNRAPLEGAVAAVKKHIGWLGIKGLDGSHAWLNETPIGTLPLKEIRVEEGSYVVKVDHEGSAPWSQTVAVTGGEVAEAVAPLGEAAAVRSATTQAVGVEVGEARPGSPLIRTLGPGLVGAGLAVAVTGTVVWLQQERGSYGTFNSGSTGPGLLIGGVVGMLAGSALIYWTTSKDSAIAVGLNGRGPVVAGSF
jgi:PEGA domain